LNFDFDMSSPSPRQKLLDDAASPEKTPFQYVIVGSGAGGGPLAARLARGGRRVLLLEAGEDLALSQAEDPGQPNNRNQVPEVQEVPCYHAAATEYPEMTWSFSVRHFADDARQTRDTKYNANYDPSQHAGQGKGGIFYPRCAALGGCTAHHALIMVAPNDRDWNEIAERTGDDSWRAERMQGYFTRIEQCLYHSIYQGFFRRTFGAIYEVARRILGWINPRAVWDLGGHGDRGWQPTSFINPDLVAKIEEGDRTFRKVLIDAVGSLLREKGALSLLKSALLQLRLVQFLDPNDRNNRRDKPEGMAFIPIGTDGRRRTGVREWLRKTEEEYPDRLVIVTGVHATRILFERKNGSDVPSAKGVEVAVGAHLYEASPLAKKEMGEAEDLQRCCYFASDEVIVCGGAFNTPQLLMLSGIGDIVHLKKCGIEHLTGTDGRPLCPSIDLPGVGRNLQDRYEISVISQLKEEFSTLKGISFEPGDVNDPARAEWLKSGTGLYTTNGGTLAILKRSGVDEQPEPDLFIFGAPASFRGYYWGWSKDLLHDKMGGTKDQRDLWSWVILKAYTRNSGGTVRLRTNSPFQAPEIAFASFSEGPPEWKKDVEALVEAVELVRDINAHAQAVFEVEIQPGKQLVNRSQALEEWIQDEAWGHHACGTCRMGSDDWQAKVTNLQDRRAVIDSKFKVHGVRNLRIVDASVFPTIPGYFLVTPVLMISEKAADTILADTQEYPDPLRIAEDAAIDARRAAAGVESQPYGHVGLALSGGGIRSATFSLGVLQALAEKDRLRLIDILSTVSGGGYIGGFLGRLFTRIPAEVVDKAGRVQDILKNLNSPEIHWLRSTANYIAGSGLVDLRQNLAVFWRNLFAVHLVIAALLMVAFGLLKWLGDRLPRPAGPFVPTFLGPRLSHWWWLVAALLLLAILPGSLGFWLAPKAGAKSPHPVYSLLAWMVLLGAAVAMAAFPGGLVWGGLAVGVLVLAYLWQEAARWNLPPGTKPGQEAAVIRSKLTIGLGEAIFIFVGAAIWVVLDTLAREAASSGLSKLMAAIVMALGPFLPLLKMAADRLGRSTSRSTGLLSKSTPALIAFPLAAFLLFVADVLVRQTFQVGNSAGLLLVVTFLVFSLIMGRAFGFLNLSSLQATYAARLTRTFLGASNPERIYGAGSSLSTEVDLSHPGDDLPFYEYHPEQKGGPLHLINVCVNETTDVRAQRDVRENKGLPMCVGPHGVSVGLRFHASWVEAQSAGRDKEQRAMARLERSVAFEGNEKVALLAIPASEDPSGFHVLGRRDGKPAAVEPLRLGQWIGISGAAVGTGEGRSTSLPLSLLYGLVNLRLGYWWNSGVNAGDRPGRFPKSLWERIKSLPATLFRTQSMILAEWRSYFPGPSDRYWYLSDGGHFEVTGIYELVRRRLPLIVAIDAGEDPDYHFNDLACLTRQIRLDFGAEVQWLDPSASRARDVTGWRAFDVDIPVWISNWLDPERLDCREKITRKGSCHASLAKIRYTDAPKQESWLVLIKTSLTGDESVDVLQYSTENDVFPNSPTTNQFFGDSEWESYRALGYHIGAKLFI
jgi:choline dehydrogenase-like flavoprotein